MRKTTLLTYYSCSIQKTAPKTAKNGEIRPLWKLPKMATKERLKPNHNAQFGWKIKNA